MYTDNAEAAYFVGRIARSKELAGAATESCARIAHMALVSLYEKRRVGLLRLGKASVAASVTRVRP